MDLLNFVLTVIFLTGSGALAPGPLFFATISHGTKSGAKSGLFFSVAHTIVEFSLVMVLAGGLISLVDEPVVRFIFGVSGGLVLLIFGTYQVVRFLAPKGYGAKLSEMTFRRQLLLGLTLTGLNPFFIIWWLTVGVQLIFISLEFASFAGVILMYICHVWIDYAWLTAVSHFAKIGMSFVGQKWYRVVMISLGFILIYFGFTFFTSSLTLS